MRALCKGRCGRMCENLVEDHRNHIWTEYWNLDYTSRRKWLYKHVKLVPVKRRTQSAKHKRSESRRFTLPLEDSTDIEVCRFTFLNTLGYTNDSVITELIAVVKQGSCGDQVKERRGGCRRQPNREIIKNHIESFKPSVSHYRRKNAPNVRYLSRELTYKKMYDDFVSKHPSVCKIEVYRQVLKEMHISLCQPKSDICEDCKMLKNMLENNEDDIIRDQLNSHRAKAEKANSIYKKDSEETASFTKRIYSMDLQKVIILPIMPQSKTAIFTSRLVVFNLTFATLNKEPKNKSYCVLWHEALGGRKAEAIVDALLEVIRKERDASHFVFWADNCTSQNKNWVLYTSLITEVNRSAGPQEIIVRYLTKGHTHMTADGIHGNIEQKILRNRNIYDFKELVELVKNSRKNLEVLELKEFHLWQNKKRTTKKAAEDPLKGFLLGNLVEVCFTRGSNCIKYKTDFDDEYKELDFLQKKHCPTFTPKTLNIRGISSEKKALILKDLVPLMPENRKFFWQTLPDSETSLDLVDHEQLEAIDSDK